jgi:hypothetical protein
MAVVQSLGSAPTGESANVAFDSHGRLDVIVDFLTEPQ